MLVAGIWPKTNKMHFLKHYNYNDAFVVTRYMIWQQITQQISTNQTRFNFSLIHLKQVTTAPWTKTGLPKRKNFQRPRNNGMRCWWVETLRSQGTVHNSSSQRMFFVLMCNLLRKFTNVCIGFIGYQFLGVAFKLHGRRTLHWKWSFSQQPLGIPYFGCHGCNGAAN